MVATAAPKMNQQQSNQALRQLVISQALLKKQKIYTFTGNPATVNNIFNINNIPNAGLLTRFIVEVIATFTTLSSGTAAITEYGVWNLLQNVQFTDTLGNQRHNTTGLHLFLASTFKRGRIWCNANTSASTAEMDIGGHTQILQGTAPTTTVAGTARAVYEIPVAISNTDLRGAIFTGITGAQLSLQLTLNPTPAPSTGDSTYAVFYGSAASSTISTVTINVYKEYYDQLPMNGGQFLLPGLDIATVYQLTRANFTGMTVGQDFQYPFTNYRKYLTQNLLYNNSGTNGGLSPDSGSDVNYLALTGANYVNLFNVGPLEQRRIMREFLGADMPLGLYAFNFAHKPIDTRNYGNMNLILNPATAGASAYTDVMSEFIAYQVDLPQAPSMPSNGQ